MIEWLKHPLLRKDEQKEHKDLEEAAEKEWRCSAVHQALTYSTRQRKTLLSLSLSLDISPSRLKGPHERRESIHLSIRGTQTRREGGRRSQRSRINKLDRSSGNFSIRSRCSWKPIVGRSMGEALQLFFTSSIRGSERTDRKAGKRKDGRGFGWLAGWPEEKRPTLCLRRRDSFLLPSLSPFRRKTFGCLPRDNFLRYVINVYGQPRLLIEPPRHSMILEKRKKRGGGGRECSRDKGRRGTEIAPRVNGRPRCVLISDSILFYEDNKNINNNPR